MCHFFYFKHLPLVIRQTVIKHYASALSCKSRIMCDFKAALEPKLSSWVLLFTLEAHRTCGHVGAEADLDRLSNPLVQCSKNKKPVCFLQKQGTYSSAEVSQERKLNATHMWRNGSLTH